ncbi:MAG TPA: spore coat protein CotH, partial [Deltaproteobacteria bacterium]|nr:spore coat protein CotH [Deltaproteobacteria bacterium]
MKVRPFVMVAVLFAACSEGSLPADSTGDSSPNGTAADLVINEVVARPTGDGPDWVELFVAGSNSVQLSQYTLVDDGDDHEPSSLGDGTLEPGEFLVLDATGSGAGVGELAFKLGGNDALTLARSGVAVDSLSWDEDQVERGTSFGRFPDGQGDGQSLSPTRGAPNEALGAAPSDGSPFITDRVIAVEIEIEDSDWQAILADPESETYQPANLVYDGERLDQVAVRVKGNSSLNAVVGDPDSVRFSFKLDTNRLVSGQKFRGVKKLNFNNGFKDPSLIREHLGYRLAREVGLPAARTAFADLTVAGIHLGLYTVVEHVDDDFVERWFDEDDGDLYKPDWPDGSLLYRGENIEDYGGLQLETNEDTSDHSAFLRFVDVINHGADEDLESVLDAEMMLRYMALNSVLVNLDSYTGNGHNYYCYEQDGVFVVIPWDLNEAFGNFKCGCNRSEILGFMMDEPTCGAVEDKPLVQRMLAVDEHRARYHALLQEMLDGPFSSSSMDSWIEEAADLIRATVAQDTTKFYTTDEFERNVSDGDVAGAIGLKAFVAERAASLQAQLKGGAPSSADGGGSCGGGGPGPSG